MEEIALPPVRPRLSRRDSRASQQRWSQTPSRRSVLQAENITVPGAMPPGRRKKGKSWRFGLAFFALALVAFTSALDATSLSIALPMIAKDLNGTSLEAFWAGISFVLTSVLFQPVCTSTSDIFGRKPVMYACIGLFGLGAIVFGSAKSMPILILGRTIQGIGGGGLEVLCQIILTDMTTLKERPLWIGVLEFVWAAGSVMGPLVGGLFSEYVSWRWIAWINLPILGVALILIPPFLTLQTIRSSMKARLRQLDWIGIPIFIAGMTSFMLSITWGGVLFPWSSWKTLLPLILGILVLMAFVAYESKPVEPMIPYRIFANRTGAIALFSSFLHGVIVWGVIFFLPVYFEGVTGDRPLRAAVEAFPLSFTITPAAVLIAIAVGFVRRYCWAIWTGWGLTTLGMGLLSLLNLTSGQATRSCLQLAAGTGIGILFPALSIPTQAAVTVDDNGLAIGTFVFMRQLGAAVGLALGTAIFTNAFKSALPKELPDQLLPLKGGNNAENFISELRKFELTAAELAPVLRAYAHALKWVWITFVVTAGIGFVASLFMKDISLENESTGKQVFKSGSATVESISTDELPSDDTEPVLTNTRQMGVIPDKPPVIASVNTSSKSLNLEPKTSRDFLPEP